MTETTAQVEAPNPLLPAPIFCAWGRQCGKRIVPDSLGDWWHWLEGNVLARRIDQGGGEHDPIPPGWSYPMCGVCGARVVTGTGGGPVHYTDGRTHRHSDKPVRHEATRTETLTLVLIRWR